MDTATKQQFNKLNTRLDAIVSAMATKKDLESFATKKDLESFATKKDLESFATKKDLDEKLARQTAELKKFAIDQQEELARLVSNSVVDPLTKRFDDFENKSHYGYRIGHLEEKLGRIETALHLTL